MKKKRKAWHSDLPWARYDEVLREQERARKNSEDNVEGDTKSVSFTAAYKWFKKWRSKGK